MNKAVLISIQPKWCELIANGKKTVEVRKTAPKLKTPFKCYIYCTKSNDERLLGIMKDGDENYGEVYRGKTIFIKCESGSVVDMYNKRQKIIGEFVCDKIDKCTTTLNKDYDTISNEEMEKLSCLTHKELMRYEMGENDNSIFTYWGLFGWHISDFKIYDKPKELSEFRGTKMCPDWDKGDTFDCTENCYNCDHYIGCDGHLPLTRPPQSWCYVEDL